MKRYIVIVAVVLCTSMVLAGEKSDSMQSEQKPQASKVAGQWWGRNTQIWGGSLGGCFVGLMGAVLGIFGGLVKARRFVLGLMKGMIVAGAVSLVVGVIALVKSQPWGVYYPLLLWGLLSTTLFAGNFRSVRRRYEQKELRKMESMDTK